MNERLFLDTSGLLCVHDQDDFRNAQAIEIFTGAKFLLTTNYVLAEFVPLSQTRGKIGKRRFPLSMTFLKFRVWN
jgi:predicted nucleic acid-binding protein